MLTFPTKSSGKLAARSANTPVRQLLGRETRLAVMRMSNANGGTDQSKPFETDIMEGDSRRKRPFEVQEKLRNSDCVCATRSFSAGSGLPNM